MPTVYPDQTISGNFDPGNPGTLPTNVTIVPFVMVDQDDNGFIEPGNGDLVNGSEVTAVWVGDTVTLNGVTITGVTLYGADGGRYFTPIDGSVLTDGIVTATTFVNTSTQLDVNDLGPICFAKGTRILVDGGQRRVEDIRVGDLVQTADRGLQPVKWIGKSRIGARGRFAPICISKGAMGNVADLYVSPQHRMLITGWSAQLHLGVSEALVAAKHLVNGDTIYTAPRDRIDYYHIMLDRHDVIFSEGIPSETFFFGDVMRCNTPEVVKELLELFPELAETASEQPSARLIVKAHEAQQLSLG